jgi:hypothetical protein
VLTLSQWGSVIIFLAAVGIEIYLRKTQPSRWGTGAAAPSSGATANPPQGNLS